MGELKLVECEASDAPELLAGHNKAFTDPIWVEPFFEVLWPEKGERIKVAHKRFLEQWLGDKSSRYIKIVDADTGMYFSVFVISPCSTTISEAQVSN